MDPLKQMKAYISPRRSERIVAIVLCAMTLVLCVLGLAALGGGDKADTWFYPDDSPSGSMAYLDIVGVSDWICEYDGAIYYNAEDAEGYLYTVRLSESQHKKMTAQQDYWNRTTETSAMPDPYRVEGLVQKIPSDIRESLAKSWGLTTSEYDQYFGATYLNTTTSAGAADSSPYFMFAIFCAVLALLFFMTSGRANKVAKKCLKQLDQAGLLDQAAEEFTQEGNLVVGKDRAQLSNSFIYGKHSGVVVPYRDILWCYKMNQRRNFIPVNSYIIVNTRTQSGLQAVDFGKEDKKGALDIVLTTIAEKNPDALMGYTQPNGNAYRELVRKK